MRYISCSRLLAFALSIVLVLCLTPMYLGTTSIYGTESDSLTQEQSAAVKQEVDEKDTDQNVKTNESDKEGSLENASDKDGSDEKSLSTNTDNMSLSKNNAATVKNDASSDENQGNEAGQGSQNDQNNTDDGDITSEDKEVDLNKDGGGNDDDGQDIISEDTEGMVTLIFDSNGGSSVAAVSAKQGDPVVMPENPLREGYTFLGWDHDVPEIMPENGMKFTAQWEINTYVILFDTDGGTDIDPYVAEYGAAVKIPNDPEKLGYIFSGWDREIPQTMPGYDMTITAVWTLDSPAFPTVDDDIRAFIRGSGIPAADRPVYTGTIPNVTDRLMNTSSGSQPGTTSGNQTGMPSGYQIVHVVNDGTPATAARTIEKTTRPVLEDFAEEEVPLADSKSDNKKEDHWALINVVCTVLMIILAALSLVSSRRRGKIQAGRSVSALIAGIAVVMLLMTQDFSAKMVSVDSFTIPMVILLAISSVVTLFTHSRSNA